MATGNFTFAANISGGPDGARTFGPVTVTYTSAVTETLPVTLSSGNNTVTVPGGSTTCVICPPNLTAPGVVAPNPSYGGTLTLKGVAGDTGVVLSAKYPTVLNWDSAPSSIVINASTGPTSVTVWFA